MKNLYFLGFFLLIACSQETPPSQPAHPALVAIVGDQTKVPPIIFIGEIRSRYESAQGFRIDGKIVKRHVEVGSIVKKGEILAQLDSSDTELSNHAAHAQLHAAEVELALSSAKLDRQRQLHQSKFISDQALETQETQLKTSIAQVRKARAQAKITGNQARYTNLLAERNGVITEIHAEPGQVIQSGEVIARIAVPDNKEVLIAIAESKMLGVNIGVLVEVKLWANPSVVYHGRVREISPAADSITRTFQVRIAIDNPDDQVRLGMTAEVKFNNQNSNHFFLPTTAVTQREGKDVAWIVDPQTGTVQHKVVKIEMFHENGVFIKEGLQNGDLFVTTGVHMLMPGQVVRPVLVQTLP